MYSLTLYLYVYLFIISSPDLDDKLFEDTIAYSVLPLVDKGIYRKRDVALC